MSKKTPAPEQPQKGGSYVREADGALKQTHATKQPDARPAPVAPKGGAK